MSNYEYYYKQLIYQVLNSPLRESRTGLVYKTFNTSLRINLNMGFPMLTGRKMYWKNVKGEAEWMLSGSTNIKDLHYWGVNIWDQFADDDGELGPTYGAQLAKQWINVMEEIKFNHTSRRHIINLWDVDEIDNMTLPPCYYSLQFYVDAGMLNMTVTSRSSDVAVGLPYDIAVLSYLLYKASAYTKLPVNTLCFNACDTHINIENVDAIREYLSAPTHQLPRLNNFELKDYIYSPHIQMTVKP